MPLTSHKTLKPLQKLNTPATLNKLQLLQGIKQQPQQQIVCIINRQLHGPKTTTAEIPNTNNIQSRTKKRKRKENNNNTNKAAGCLRCRCCCCCHRLSTKRRFECIEFHSNCVLSENSVLHGQRIAINW